MSMIITILSIVGGFVIIKHVSSLIRNVYTRFLLAPVDPKLFGAWSIVTGSTDGIGKSISVELAKKGVNLILISRTQEKLDEVAASLTRTYPTIKVETLAVDFSTFDFNSPRCAAVRDVMKRHAKDLGLLVNNVGMSYPFPKYYHELEDQEVSDLIKLNVTSTSVMTKIFLDEIAKVDKIVRDEDGSGGNSLKRKFRAGVVNVGSYAGIFPSPLLAEYSAAKSFVETLTRSLAVEYARKDQAGVGRVMFQCHVPLYIVSKMSKFKKSTSFIPSSEAYAKSVLNNLGKDVVVSGHFLQSVATELVKFVPEGLMLRQVKDMHLAIRKRGMAKMERDSKTK